MSDLNKRVQETHSNAVFDSIKDTLSLGVEEMKKTIIDTFQGSPGHHTDPKIPRNTYKKGQLPQELDRREDALSNSRT